MPDLRPLLIITSGSLVARILFQPVEEMTRVFVSRTMAPPISSSVETSTTPTPTSRRLALGCTAKVLISILSIQVAMSLLVVSLAPAYMNILLHVILPPRYQSTSAPLLLSAWVWYIPVLAVNGVLEAFMAAVSTPADLNQQSR
jgi:oligosaccharide translocation protein RFT1